jgi:ribulose-phosphate 3-epimerase
MSEYIEIVPAILEKDFAQIEQKLALVREAGVKNVQIDICDGHFVPSKTFGSAGCAESFARLAEMTVGLELELDMMINWDSEIIGRFDKWIETVQLSQCSRVVLHYTSVSNLNKWQEITNLLTIDETNISGLKIGLGVSLDDDLSKVAQLLESLEFDFVQVMGITQIGFGGQQLDARALEVVASLHKLYPKLEISVDGGVKLHNAVKLTDAGATRLVAGSALFGSNDVAQAVVEMKNEISK